MELVAVLLCQRFGGGRIGRRAVDDVRREFRLERLAQTVLYERDGEVRDVYAYPATLEPLGHVDRRAATAERVEHNVALV